MSDVKGTLTPTISFMECMDILEHGNCIDKAQTAQIRHRFVSTWLQINPLLVVPIPNDSIYMYGMCVHVCARYNMVLDGSIAAVTMNKCLKKKHLTPCDACHVLPLKDAHTITCRASTHSLTSAHPLTPLFLDSVASAHEHSKRPSTWMVESDKRPPLWTSKCTKHLNTLMTTAMPYAWDENSVATSKSTSKKHACAALLCYLIPAHVCTKIELQIAQVDCISDEEN